jgi:small subunit ribosomal protein S17
MAERKQRKTRIGNIVSDKMDKTVVVAVETSVRHPLYGRIVRRTKKYKAHDEQNTCRIGDKVRIMETRPLSKEKRWRVSEILSRAVQLGPLRREDNANDPAADDA